MRQAEEYEAIKGLIESRVGGVGILAPSYTGSQSHVLLAAINAPAISPMLMPRVKRWLEANEKLILDGVLAEAKADAIAEAEAARARADDTLKALGHAG